MWLPRSVYEFLPLAYTLGGAALVGVAFRYGEMPWAEWLAVGGALGLVIGLTLILRRRGYRASRSRLDFTNSR